MTQRLLRQWMTPEWAARELFDHFAPGAGPEEFVLEPSCGTGAFLKAVPDGVPAVGIELDPRLAALARAATGRQVIVGDFRTVEIPYRPTLILGNPPYQTALFEQFLSRCRRLLPDGGRAGFLVSTHMVQTPSAVVRWNDHWSVEHRIVPRTLFPRAIRPLSFLVFTKDRLRRMYGFLLYEQSRDVLEMSQPARVLLCQGVARKTCWRALVEWSLRELGGEAGIPDVYRLVSPRRPSGNRWWQEKVRQILQQHFRKVRRGVYALN